MAVAAAVTLAVHTAGPAQAQAQDQGQNREMSTRHSSTARGPRRQAWHSRSARRGGPWPRMTTTDLVRGGKGVKSDRDRDVEDWNVAGAGAEAEASALEA
ncbi:hypothetical protein AYL99_02897 [Fonsecaea erecta]|uniref:Uncharacterized protein n=1 Tax=Fonsecaea erecta TaxID=1367422 RepID=A0A178ZV67_9EURO|nr:hypothetical protein AYL99_02897 [Fonsecaea erecta]OAP63670.1 hypothetical protein AYL99_02897 [Fonsecaea erecta]